MSYRQVLYWSVVLAIGIFFLSGCAGASPTPGVVVPPATPTPLPPNPPVVLPAATDVLSTDTAAPTVPTQLTSTDLTTTPDGTATPQPVVATENPVDQPFLMRIDRVSVVVGRGTLLEGRVAHGTLQGNTALELLGSQNFVLSTSIVAILISNTVQDQVTVGDYAGILVQGIEAGEVSPGMLLAEAGAYDSYDEALQELQ